MCACKREGKGGREGEEGEHEYRSIDVSGRRERPAGSTTPADENAGRGGRGLQNGRPGTLLLFEPTGSRAFAPQATMTWDGRGVENNSVWFCDRRQVIATGL